MDDRHLATINSFREALRGVPDSFEKFEAAWESVERYFKDQKDLVFEVYQFLVNLEEEIFLTAPSNIGDGAVSHLHPLVGSLVSILRFDPVKHDKPQDQITRLSKDLDNHYSQAFTRINPLFSSFNYRNRAHQVERVFDDLKKSEGEAKSISKELSSILSAARTSSAQIGVAEHAEIFRSESQKYGRMANTWLIATIFFAILGAAAIICIWYTSELPNELTLSEFAKWGSLKLFVVSFFYVMLAFCIKNYSMARHNTVVNKHRASAMQTFELFANATKSDETKDVVLKQVTQCIFSHQRSGVFSKENSESLDRQIIQFIADRRVTESE